MNADNGLKLLFFLLSSFYKLLRGLEIPHSRRAWDGGLRPTRDSEALRPSIAANRVFQRVRCAYPVYSTPCISFGARAIIAFLASQAGARETLIRLGLSLPSG